MTNRKWVAVVVVLVITAFAGTGVVRFRAQKKAQAASAAVSVKTTQVQRRTLASSVDASGQLESTRESDLYNKVSGKVVEVLVRPGQTVKAGQIMVRLTSDDATLAIDNATDDLAMAKAKLTSAKDDYNNAPNNTQVQLQKARQELYNAKLKLEELATPKTQDVEQAKANLRQAQINLRSAQEELDTQAALFKVNAIPKVDYQQYVDKVTLAKDSANNAQIKLDTLLAGGSQKEKDSAAAAVQQAEINLKLAEQNAAKAVSKQAVIQAEAEVRKAEKALQTAKDNLASLTVKAPFAGMVIQVNAVVGKEINANATPVVKMVASDKWQVVAYADESDVAQLKEGQRVEVTVSAMEDRQFTGRLTAIGGEAKTSQSVVTYPIYITMDTFNPIFRPGMTADAVVQVLYKPNVLVVPETAVTERRGKAMVQVPSDDNTEEPSYMRVETGDTGDGYIEITSGVEEGQVVILPSRTSTTTQTSQNAQSTRQNDMMGGAPPMMMMGAPR